MRSSLYRAVLVGSVAAGTVLSLTGVGLAGTPHASLRGAAAAEMRAAASTSDTGSHLGDDTDLADTFAQYDYERTAPATSVSGEALVTAQQQSALLGETGGQWQEFTNQPYQGQPAAYTDPFWGNQGAGFSLVGGRVTALASTPDGAWFAGTADGGVWRSYNQGTNWTPVFDTASSLSIGALAVDPANGSLWVGTGEANLSQDSYAGTGVYQTYNDGHSFRLVGQSSNPIAGRTVFKIAFDSRGDAYAATDNGLFRYSARTREWTEVLDPAGATDSPPYDQQVTSVAVVPGTGGKDVIAAIGWHGPGNTEYNGFYSSANYGASFSEVTPGGDVVASDIGRTTFAYSADGTRLYAIVQSVSAEAAGKESVLQGVYVATGSAGSPASVAGPWKKIGDEATLAASGSALAVGSGYGVGVQAWYNQVITVDPSDANHVYIGLEEVFESTNAGTTWVTASPYWNYTLSCASTAAGCPNTTHPDQHAQMIVDGKIVIGNDGGVYSRPLSDTQQYGDWTDLNSTLRSWQYYDARAGSTSAGTLVFGGLQDNGSSVLTSGTSPMDEAAGGDGTDVIVDPANGNNLAGEYTDGSMYSSTDGGHTFSDVNVSPTCASEATYGITPLPNCDASARFVTPLIQDQQNADTWVLGGQYVWVTKSGWSTVCNATTCSWTPVYNTGTGHAVTALSSADNGKVIYAAWTANGGNPGSSFAVGIATNEGGTWHEVNTASLPDRYISGVTVDPANPAHAYAIFNGYSRRWIPGGGVGHVYETWNGGASWTDISGNLPDIASDALVLSGGKLALATDLGVYAAREGGGAGTRWERLGSGLPNAAVDDLTAGPGGYVYAATHGRGVWRIRL